MDKINKQILEILVINCRMPLSTIAKALRLSKDTISYRINKLKEKGIYLRDSLFVDARRLGYTRYQIFISLNPKIENREIILENLSKYNRIVWMNTFIGKYEIHIVVDAKDAYQLEKIKKEIFGICEHKVKSHKIVANHFDIVHSLLNPEIDLKTKFELRRDFSFSSSLAPKSFPLDEEFEIYNASKLDIEILNILSENPQESLTVIGDKLGVDRKTVRKRILLLIENKVIISFGAIIDTNKFGYVSYTLMIRLLPETSNKVLADAFKGLNNIYYAAKLSGEYDFIIYLNARNPDELNQTIQHFKDTIGDFFSEYEIAINDKILAWKQFTSGIYEELRS